MVLVRYFILLVFIPPFLLGCAGATFTWQKLSGMRQVRGFMPGATVTPRIISDKWLQPPDTRWISWGEQSIRRRGDHRLNVPASLWESVEIGDEIEIVYLPPSTTPYHREGIYASDGNFAFDYGLLVFELGLILLALAGVPATLWYLHRTRFRPLGSFWRNGELS